MTHCKRCSLTLLLLSSFFHVAAQMTQEKDALRQKRFKMIEFSHIGTGIETGFNQNFVVGVKGFAGIGSYRNFFSADVGLKLLWTNPISSSYKERITMWQMPVFIAVSTNLLRWQQYSIYLGGEIDYHLKVGAKHKLSANDALVNDRELGCSHTSASLRLGLRLNKLDIGLFYEYDLSPSFNQKHVYESPTYDYDALHDAIFERIRFGMSISYLFPL